ncbi:hypothetical protein LIER_42152 [Lithospermum erythrorhizon]|uniref:Uncharacterized protein n=1 Tax=Lithospermum erythrorhizon TaxID=34254 RepID=A0AAV3Q7V1_LITER
MSATPNPHPEMPHRTRPMAALLLFTGVNAVLVSTIGPVYDFVCFLPYWERRVCLFSTLSPSFFLHCF